MKNERPLSMPYWCVGNPVGDPFGPGVLDRMDSVALTDILCEAKADGLIEFTAAHDDDLVPWDPHNENDDQDTGSETYRTLKTIRNKLDKAGLGFKMVTCSLHGDPVFRNGGLTNPDPRVRALAAKKVMRTLRIGDFLGAEYFTYWVARDGFETQFAVDWGNHFKYLQQGLNLAARYAQERNLSIRKGTIENKPNEPRGEMFLPTVGHSLALISTLEAPDFWGVNPELLQHEQMTGLTGVAAAAFAASMGKLFFLHVGNQKPDQFDNDNPVMIGMDGIKEFISVLWVLDKMGWDGHVEYDNHMLRTDTAPGSRNGRELRQRFIKLNVDSFRLAEKKARQLGENADIAALQKTLWNGHQHVARALDSGSIDSLSSLKIDYDGVNGEPVEIGQLDMMVNRALLGM
jgi:xylose isomerase